MAIKTVCVCVCALVVAFMCMWFSYQVVSERMTEVRNENDDLRSAAVTADEYYQKVLAEKGMLEVDLNRARDDNNRLVQQVCYAIVFQINQASILLTLSLIHI